MNDFEYNANPGRVIFGSGTIKKLPAELERQHLARPLLLSTPEQAGQAGDLEKMLGAKAAGVFSQATMHTPTGVTDKALEYARAQDADCLPHICIPTTYAGSEMTPILGETADGVKTTRSDPKILPGTVIYDVDLTMTLPVGMSAVSGVNAIAHAVEALYARNTNPIISLLAVEGTRALASALPQIAEDPGAQPARSLALYGAWLCGTCLGSVGMSLHHKLCHALGGSLGLPHAETHTAVLPHAVAYNAPRVPEAMARLAGALAPGAGRVDGAGRAEDEEEEGAVRGLNVLLDRLKVKRGLREFGMKEEDIDRAADVAVSNPYWNPREIEREPIRELIRRAWAGEPARADL